MAFATVLVVPLACGADCGTPLGTPVPKGSFIRIFPEATVRLDNADGETALQRLANAMTAKKDTAHATNLPPGYTYFGQFIDHDLMWNRLEFDAAYEEQVKAPNFRSSFLDLDSVYGDGPRLDCQFEGPKDAETFIIGPTAPTASLKGGNPKDVPFDGDRPIIGNRLDLRNAENLITRQLHVVFLKFHNRVIKELPKHGGDSDVPQEGTLFERTRTLVTWTYQYLVWNDFLYRIRGTDARNPKPSPSPANTYKIPLEFALAGFRFGHSMVLPEYALNCHHKFFGHTPSPILNLINSSKEKADRLTEEYAIEWHHFFRGVPKPCGSVAAINAGLIDTEITSALGMLPPGVFPTFTNPTKGKENPNLAYRTLSRGARARLASGQQVAAEMKAQNRCVEDIDQFLKEDKPLQDAKLTENTPLWYYILKEAEVANKSRPDRLGRLGTCIVESTIEGALQHDPNSYLRQKGENWRPPDWLLPTKDMAGLISFAEANVCAEGCP